MAATARLLELLGLLQARSGWTGPALAARLEVSTRTVCHDVERLRALGYEIRSRPGRDGGYALGPGTALPPLLLDEEEAVAVAVALRAAAGSAVAGVDETAARALAKLEQTMPSRLRHRVRALREVTESAPRPWTGLDPAVMDVVTTAAARHERLRFDYTGADGARSRRDVEPYRLVHTGRRWYLLAWDTRTGDWRTFRADRMEPRTPTGPRFTPRPLPEEGATAHVLASVGVRARPAQVHVRIHAPVAQVADRVAPVGGELRDAGPGACELVAGGRSLDELLGYVASLGVPFDVVDPPELRDVARRTAERLLAAAGAQARSFDVTPRGPARTDLSSADPAQ